MAQDPGPWEGYAEGGKNDRHIWDLSSGRWCRQIPATSPAHSGPSPAAEPSVAPRRQLQAPSKLRVLSGRCASFPTLPPSPPLQQALNQAGNCPCSPACLCAHRFACSGANG